TRVLARALRSDYRATDLRVTLVGDEQSPRRDRLDRALAGEPHPADGLVRRFRARSRLGRLAVRTAQPPRAKLSRPHPVDTPERLPDAVVISWPFASACRP